MKINIIGYSGAGKSTLTKYLGQYYDCPYLFLDTINFIDHWQERDHDEAIKIVENFMTNDSYVIDGNYKKFLYDKRMANTDYIIFLNFNRFTCLYRAFKRYLKYRGQTRESSGANCNEKFDFEFFMWIIKDGRSKTIKKGYRQLAKQYPSKFIEIKNQKQLNHFYTHIKTYLD